MQMNELPDSVREFIPLIKQCIRRINVLPGPVREYKQVLNILPDRAIVIIREVKQLPERVRELMGGKKYRISSVQCACASKNYTIFGGKNYKLSLNHLFVKPVDMKDYKDFIPKDSAGLGLWAHNYKTRFPDVAPELPDAITAEDISIQQQYAQEIIDALNNVERMKAELAAAVSLKDRVVAANSRKMRNMAIKIKHSRHYDDSIGAALDIIYRGRTIYDPELTPDIKVVANANFVEIHFTKSRAMGAVIFGRYPGGEWEMLGKTRISPYIDSRPLKVAHQPERREYMVRIWDGFQCIGQESQIAGTVFNG